MAGLLGYLDWMLDGNLLAVLAWYLLALFVWYLDWHLMTRLDWLLDWHLCAVLLGHLVALLVVSIARALLLVACAARLLEGGFIPDGAFFLVGC